MGIGDYLSKGASILAGGPLGLGIYEGGKYLLDKAGGVGGVMDWLGGTSMEEGLQQLGLEDRAGLEALYRGAGGLGYDPNAALMNQAQRLEAIAGGGEMGAGQVAAQRMGREALANIASQGAGAAGYGAGATAREALRASAGAGQRVAAEQSLAALRDQEQAQAALQALYGGMAQRQLAGVGGIAGLRQAELAARTPLVTGEAQQPAPWETLAGLGLQVGGMIAGA